MKTIILSLTILLTPLLSHAAFNESWIYLYKGEEPCFPLDSIFTDIACFSASINEMGGLTGGHLSPPTLAGTRANARFHLVITMPWNKTLAHIYLNKELPLRNRIIQEIVERSKPFDGVQIDIEAISPKDGTAYLNFLGALKDALPKNKIFSVAVLARWESYVKAHPTDAFSYPFINRIADRVIVMAYDEHYRSGPPGPIASLSWCNNIYEYAKKTIDPKKLIMGIPLYGRSWQKQKFAQAYKNDDIQSELRKKSITPSKDLSEGGHYRYTSTVDIDVHFETIESIKAKWSLYDSKQTQGVAFWRIGQEPSGLWDALKD